MAAKYHVLGSGEAFRFNLKAGNGEIILTSESYQSKSAALNGIESCKKSAADDARYDRRIAKNEQPYFVLKAGNGEIIGKSEMYSGNAAMENGIASVKKNGPDAEIDDDTQ